ncbi:hypothetical protein [Rhizobium sp. NFR03]|uniref:hypothetical protein n=1 Tax=Rhizobium sp. NFR03 TaxID=1566263 RepID=UPI0008CF2FD4|nr:hypothetical protein [Rhizobium sp. NFR03]SES24427.1 hypothetical protein SAMN03159406_02933 [Rhizobium sp. NFR03]
MQPRRAKILRGGLGAGNDILDGGGGFNELSGGRGSGTFVFKTGITEIDDVQSGVDRLQISKTLGVTSSDDILDLARSTGGDDDISDPRS